LVFVRGVADSDKQQPGKHDWVVFLSTDSHLEPQKILELYAMRWAIEVYFKESKQHLGFLKEQARHNACYISSIHLSGASQSHSGLPCVVVWSGALSACINVGRILTEN